MASFQEHLNRGIREARAGALSAALEAYQEAANSSDPAIRAEALTRMADIRRERCEWEDAHDAARLAQSIAREAGLEDRLVEAKIAEANTLMTRGKFADAMPLYEDIARSAPNPRVRGVALQNIGSMLAQMGRFPEARDAFQRSLAHFEEARYDRGKVFAWNNLGRLALDQKDFAAAEPLFRRALAEANEVGDLELVALAQENLAAVLSDTGDIQPAFDFVHAALGYFTSSANRLRQIECLRLLGALNEQGGDLSAAGWCYERALEFAEEIGSEVERRVTRHRMEALARKAAAAAGPPTA